MVKKKYSLKVVGTRLVREKTLYSPKTVTDPEVAIEVICDFLHDFRLPLYPHLPSFVSDPIVNHAVADVIQPSV